MKKEVTNTEARTKTYKPDTTKQGNWTDMEI